jgi:hypothetical protein
MAGYYFELLTEQEGIPAKPFDPVGELKRLRRRLALRLQDSRTPVEYATLPMPETISLEAVVKKVSGMKKTLAIWQRSRSRARQPHCDIFRGNWKVGNARQVPSVIIQYLNSSKEGPLETVNAGLTALGVVGIVFGALSLFYGWESGLSLGSLVCISGTTIIAIGLTGRILASHSD